MAKKSYMGACLTFLTVFVTCGFLYTKIQTLNKKHDVDIMGALLERAVPYTEPFNAINDGFFLAAALTDYDTNEEIVEEDRYGELFIEHYGWGYSDGIGNASGDISYHYCSEEEIGLVDSPNRLIYPIIESAFDEVQLYRKKFKCINREDLQIWGDYNSKSAQ